MKLTIIRPDQILEYDILWLEVITDLGSFVIQVEHAPTVFVLKPGQPLTFGLTNGKQESMAVVHGVVEVTRSAVMALLGESP